ncbi:MAG: gamma-glutamyl-gamma-aminobutyrate hydrolase family protein [Myxococcota bacterium]
MTRLLVFQHVPFEILGTLNPLFKSHGFRIRYMNFGRHPDAQPTLAGYEGLVVLGGPMSAYDSLSHPHLDTEVRAIESALGRGLPVLGICLGAQLLARALGARVRPHAHREIGWVEVTPTPAGRRDRLLRHLGEAAPVFQWHGDTFDLPSGAEHLASSRECAQQAFRYGESAYGLQFHLEVDRSLIERWLRMPIYQREIAEYGRGLDPEEIRRETREKIPALERLADRCFSEFIALFGPHTRRSPAPHR